MKVAAKAAADAAQVALALKHKLRDSENDEADSKSRVKDDLDHQEHLEEEARELQKKAELLILPNVTYDDDGRLTRNDIIYRQDSL